MAIYRYSFKEGQPIDLSGNIRDQFTHLSLYPELYSVRSLPQGAHHFTPVDYNGVEVIGFKYKVIVKPNGSADVRVLPKSEDDRFTKMKLDEGLVIESIFKSGGETASLSDQREFINIVGRNGIKGLLFEVLQYVPGRSPRTALL